MDDETRWIQRFDNYVKALDRLEGAIDYIDCNFSDEDNPKDNLMRQGLIQNFEYTHELAWRVMKDFFKGRGNPEIYGSRDATREAFKTDLIQDGEVWMEMIKSRNSTSHRYSKSNANKVFARIRREYYPAFVAFRKTMEGKKGNNK